MSKLTVRRPEMWVPLCMDMSLRADWERLDEQLRKAQKGGASDRITGNVEATRLAEQIRELEAQMESQTVRFRLRALPRSRWSELVAAHPERDGDEEDKKIGLNRETFFDAVLTATDRAGVAETIVTVRDSQDEVVDFDVDDWPELADEMTDHQYAEFANAIFLLNRGKVSIPFSRAASRTTQDSDET